MTLLLQYLGECIIRLIVLLEYLNYAFCMHLFLAFYNSVIVYLILVSSGPASTICNSLLWWLSTHSFLRSQQLLIFLYTKINHTIFTKIAHIFVVSFSSGTKRHLSNVYILGANQFQLIPVVWQKLYIEILKTVYKSSLFNGISTNYEL